jgi:hypothetical protein
MKALALGIAAAGLAVGMAAAQSTAPRDHSPSDKAAAAGNSNQAVATTDANAPTPAKGSNSFTEGQAKSRLEKEGFVDVGPLKKDRDGVWRGSGKKGGQQVSVWVDYKGNVGQQ